MAPKSTLSKKLSNLLTPSKKKTNKRQRFNPQSTIGKIKAARIAMAHLHSDQATIDTSTFEPHEEGEKSDMEPDNDQTQSAIGSLLSAREGLSTQSPSSNLANRHRSTTQLGDLAIEEKPQITQDGKKAAGGKNNASAKRKTKDGPGKTALLADQSGASIEVKDMRTSTDKRQEGASRNETDKQSALGLLSVLDNHAASGQLFQPPTNIFRTQQSARTSVLCRRTARAEKWRKAHPQPFKETSKVRSADMREREMERKAEVKEAVNTSSFPLLKLGCEIRHEIWRHVVVEDKVFIWPDSKLGREQPDLAMVNRQIRGEALPIYYAENIFAVDISPAMMTERGLAGSCSATSLGKIAIWIDLLQSAGLAKFVRNWAFSYTPPEVWSTDPDQDGVECDDESFVVSIRLHKETSPLIEVEVHRDARCLLSGLHTSGNWCAVSDTPAWLVKYTKVLETSCQDGFKACLVSDLAKTLTAHAGELQEARCQNRELGYQQGP